MDESPSETPSYAPHALGEPCFSYDCERFDRSSEEESNRFHGVKRDV
jgi:hypothetical protein